MAKCPGAEARAQARGSGMWTWMWGAACWTAWVVACVCGVCSVCGAAWCAWRVWRERQRVATAAGGSSELEAREARFERFRRYARGLGRLDADEERRWVVVTGTSSGIGLASAAAAVAAGFGVYATVRRAEDSTALAESVGGAAFEAWVEVVVCDVTDDATMAALGAAITRPVWGVVCCAGISVLGTVEETPPDAWRRQLDVNVVGTVRTLAAVLPHIRATGAGGRVVVVGSLFGLLADFPGFGPYAASKFALEALVRTLREELAPHAVDVVMINPAGIATPFIAKLVPELPPTTAYPRAHARLADFIAHTSTGTATDVAATIVRALTSAHPYHAYPVGPQAGTIALSAALTPLPLLRLMASTGFPQRLLFRLNTALRHWTGP